MFGSLGLCVLGVGVIATHDYLEDRSEYDPTLAYFKSQIFAGSRIGDLRTAKLPSLSHTSSPPFVTEVHDGLYHVVSWVEDYDESGAWKRTNYECTLECSGLDDWRIVDLKIGDGPVVLLNEGYGATGQFNRLWSYRISRLFGQ